MKSALLILAIGLVSYTTAVASAVDSVVNLKENIIPAAQAPESVDRISYLRFLNELGVEDIESVKEEPVNLEDLEFELNEYGTTKYYNHVFDWFEDELARDQARIAAGELIYNEKVNTDDDGLFIDTKKALKQAEVLEGDNYVELGTSFGADVQQMFDADLETTMAVYLYRSGKPLDATEGVTYPKAARFSFRKETSKQLWAENTWLNHTIKRGTGILKDWNDHYIIMVREAPEAVGGGYDMLVHFIGRGPELPSSTATKASITLLMFRPLADGRTLVKSRARHVGQSYALLGNFGIDVLRAMYGFNPDETRAEMKFITKMVKEYKETGTIAGGPQSE